MKTGYLFRFALQSLLSRRIPSLISVLIIAFSISLFTGSEQIRSEIRNQFQGSIRGIDLIVGAKGGRLQLLLYSVFHIGGPIELISGHSLEELAGNPAVRTILPFSMGDSFRGYPVIGTTRGFFTNYKTGKDRGSLPIFAKGETFADGHGVVIGSKVARSAQIETGDRLRISHGISKKSMGLPAHEEHLFHVTGILAPTGSPIDESLFISLQGMEEIHSHWNNGIPPEAKEPEKLDEASVAKSHGGEGHTSKNDRDRWPDMVQGAFVVLDSPVSALGLERSLNQGDEMMAIMPGRVIGELWSGIGFVESGLVLITGMIVLVGVSGMFLALYSSLDLRRNEVAILRTVGASPLTIFFLLQVESFFIVASGIVLSFFIRLLVFSFAGMIAQEALGMELDPFRFSPGVYVFYVVSFLVGMGAGLVPGWKAYRMTLADGLNPGG